MQLSADPTKSPTRRLAVCMCTYKRPDVLARLLERIELCARDVPEDVSVGVVVVDDDPDASARETVAAARPRFAFLEYSVTGSGDISAARNRALELGLENGELLALIDDDCMPEPQWLRELVSVQAARDAEIVSGACDTSYPPGAPQWLRDEPFDDPRWTLPNGAEAPPGYVKNLLVTAAFLRRTGLRFDPDYGRSSGEDALFLKAAEVAGARTYFAAEAVVWEGIPADRAHLRYQLRRRFWYGNTEAVTWIASGQGRAPRTALSGIRHVAKGVVRPLSRLARRQTPQLRFAVGEMLRGIGKVLGALGIRVRHR